ncbi:phosphotransferase [Coraliomargarita akajimensis]|uniref:CHK kinase-like domain-containing protein n=1 Tax=Coraliomargarita akajimensis (strain DSM 45221 / IAM 15411 / JCM 23193 / KCTC 12865 / 04OKA010-24) TaxID=583355 RepID=D5ELU1_CORAD|nr:phosphotransferase [Coraliomargarita akajimensis]ADE53266.1 protein of unknown function DUF227 [Coraliomargarita akajimensis DSM 45221]
MEPEAFICSATGAAAVEELEILQSLWSGYGSIVRYGLEGASIRSVILKRVCPPNEGAHPRGWNTDRSHQRKLRSYEVETEWYRQWSAECGETCRVPHCLAVEQHPGEVWLLLEDLDAAGFAGRRTQLSTTELYACLSWLANFHARFIASEPKGLWPIGTYWHLDTRPDELKVLATEDPALHAIAGQLDQKLSATRFPTLVHGDAKVANFCFSQDGRSVAAVDFQYVGGGCGMKDVAYFIGSCLPEEACEARETELLDRYFSELRSALSDRSDYEALEAEWRSLYPLAWADFHRFLKGWSPGHWKLHDYSERVTRSVIEGLQGARG